VRSSRMRSLSVLALVLFLPARAFAAAMPPPAQAAPMPGIVVTGRASLTGVRLGIHCARTNFADDSSICHVEVLATLRAIEAVEIRVPEGAVTTIAGDPVSGFVALEPDQTVALGFSFDRDLSVSTRDVEGPWLLWAPRARHLLLGQSSDVQYSGDGVGGELFGGADLAIEGAIHVEAALGPVHARIGDVAVDGSMDVTDPRGAISLDIDAPDDEPQVLQNGGPYLGGGIMGSLDDDDGRGAMRVGYEIGLADWVLVGVGIETDFDSLLESVLVEIATPELAILIPSISAGIGIVARQLGPRDADAALRFALGYQVVCFGAYADFDYWPAIGEWTLAAGGRISI